MVRCQGPLWARGAGPLEARATLWVSCEVHPPPDQINSQCRLANNIAESLAESAAAYTKATARKCLLEKVEVITGEEAESNVLQVRRARPRGPVGAASGLLVLLCFRAKRSVLRQSR